MTAIIMMQIYLTKTHNRRQTTADKDNDVTVYNHTLRLVPNSCKLGFGKEYLASCIQRGDKIHVRCNLCHTSINNIRSAKK